MTPRLEAQFEPSTLIVDGAGRLTFVFPGQGREEIVGTSYTWEDAKRAYGEATAVWCRFVTSLRKTAA